MKSTNLIDKFNDDHINTIIQNMENESKRQFEFARLERRYNCFYVVLVIVVFMILVFTVGSDSDLFQLLITIVSVAAGGFGIGLAYKRD